MKKITALILGLMLSVNLFAQGAQVALMGYGSSTLNIIDMQTKQSVWSYVFPTPSDYKGNSVFLLEDGEHLVVSTSATAQVISLKTKEKVWEYRPSGGPKSYEIHAVVPTKGGGFSVFVCKTPVEVIEVSKDFEIKNKLKFTELKGETDPHQMFRLASTDKKGNYLLPWYGDQTICRISPKGKIIDAYKVNVDAFGVTELSNGNLLYTSGNTPVIFEYDVKKKKVVKEIKTYQKEGKRAWMQYAGQVELIGEDKYLVPNWTGHSKQKRASRTDYFPVLMILDSKGEISWDLSFQQATAMGVQKGFSGYYYSEKPIVK
ncbi:MAG: hypothetical protein R3Y38_01345 [Rikenellaceae bacterium]